MISESEIYSFLCYWDTSDLSVDDDLSCLTIISNLVSQSRLFVRFRVRGKEEENVEKNRDSREAEDVNYNNQG